MAADTKFHNKNNSEENIRKCVQWKQSDTGHRLLCNGWWIEWQKGKEKKKTRKAIAKFLALYTNAVKTYGWTYYVRINDSSGILNLLRYYGFL